jgi:hypothetical protein
MTEGRFGRIENDTDIIWLEIAHYFVKRIDKPKYGPGVFAAGIDQRIPDEGEK